MRGTSFLIFSENCRKISTANAQIWHFLINFKWKGGIFCQIHWIPCYLPRARMLSLVLQPNLFKSYGRSYLRRPLLWPARASKGLEIGLLKSWKHQRYAVLIYNWAPKSTSTDLTVFESNYTLNEIHEQTLISAFQRSSIALLIIHHPKYKKTHIFSCSAYFLNSTILISVSPNSVISTIICEGRCIVPMPEYIRL